MSLIDAPYPEIFVHKASGLQIEARYSADTNSVLCIVIRNQTEIWSGQFTMPEPAPVGGARNTWIEVAQNTAIESVITMIESGAIEG